MIAQSSRLVFRVESDLEDYLEVHLSSLLLLLGQDLLIIGRQMKTGFGGRIDLLAIDATGVIYIIELKVAEADPEVIAQVLGYLLWIKRLNREEIIRVIASGDLKVDLEDAFQRHFGHPLPETVNGSQVLMFIAASIHRRTALGILQLQDNDEYTITTFRYVVEQDVVGLIQCCRDEQDVEVLHAETRRLARRKRSAAAKLYPSPAYKVRIDEDTRRFWLTHAQHFNSPLVSFSNIYEMYRRWLLTQADEGLQLPLRTHGQFGRQLAAITAESAEWARVFVAPGSNMDAHETSMDLPSARTQRDFDHRIVAYQRTR